MNLGQKVKHQVFSFEVRRGSGSKSKPAVQALSLGARIFLLVETPKKRRKWGESKGAREVFFSLPPPPFPSFTLAFTLRVAISTLPSVPLS